MHRLVSVIRSGLCRAHLATWPLAVVLVAGACSGPSVAERDRAAQVPSTAPPGALVPATPPAKVRAARPPDAPIVTDPGSQRYRSRVAILLPLSGQDAGLGQALLRAAQMALFDVAANDFVLMPFDTKGTPEGAETAAREALDNGVSLILGPIFSTSVAEVAPLARRAGVNVIAFSNNRAVAGNGVYLIGLLPREQVLRVVSYAFRRGLRRFAALVPATDFGEQVTDDFRDAVTLAGGVIAHIEPYDPKERDPSAAVRRLARYDQRKATLNELRSTLMVDTDETATRQLADLKEVETIGDVGFDAVLLPISGQRLRSISALMHFYDIDTSKVRLLGLASWNARGIGREPSLVGGWFAAPSSPETRKFNAAYLRIFQNSPHALAPLAYDAAALAAVLARASKGEQFSAARLTNPNGFAGRAGIFRFLSTGEAQRGLGVMQINRRGIRLISRAPRTFQHLGQ